MAGHLRGGHGHRSRCLGRHTRHPDVNVSGSRSRVRRPGVLCDHGRTLRLHGPQVAYRRGSRLEARGIAPLGWSVLALVPAQIALGSWLRHFGTREALAAHAFLAIAVLVTCLSLAFIVERHGRTWGPLVPAARALGLLVLLQLTLGVGEFVSLLPFDGTPRTVTFYQAVTRTAHQTSGALLLAAAVVFNLRSFRHLASRPLSFRKAEEVISFHEADPVVQFDARLDTCHSTLSNPFEILNC